MTAAYVENAKFNFNLHTNDWLHLLKNKNDQIYN